MHLRQGWRWIPLLLLLGMLVTACGGQAAAYGSQPGGAAPTATAGSQPTMAGTGNKTVVEVQNFSFSPASITIKAGTTVEWHGKSGTHEVKNDPGSSITFDGPLDTNATFDVVFTTPGTYHYHCEIHPSMVAVVTVTA